MQNPFDLPGPQFLVFYLALGIMTLMVTSLWMRFYGASGQRVEIRDPYQIAYLRGGAAEVLRVVLFSLADRGLLKQAGSGRVRAANVNAVGVVRRPVERFVLEQCAASVEVGRLVAAAQAGNYNPHCEEFRIPLANAGLVVCGRVYRQRLLPFAAGLALLGGTAVIKLALAYSRGRHNIWFLVTLAGTFVVILLVQFFRRRSALGDAELRALRQRFEHLRTEVSHLLHGGDTYKTTMVAAIFGLNTLSRYNYPHVRDLFPRASSTPGSIFGGCGSSGCSGGSGCGGGGGGGGGCGGGGCGGCGG